jgi:hypothetical protein
MAFCFILKMEIWKTIEGYEDYQVSNLGNVKSTKKGIERRLKPGLGKGYLKVVLWMNGKPTSRTVHQLVAESFLNHTPSGHKLVVDHINDVKTDNRAENLQIVTSRFNAYKTQGNYSSSYKGVNWRADRNKWRSQLRVKGKSIHLGYFINETEASEAYQKALKEHGE